MFFSFIHAKQQSVALPAAVEKALAYLKSHDFTKRAPVATASFSRKISIVRPAPPVSP